MELDRVVGTNSLVGTMARLGKSSTGNHGAARSTHDPSILFCSSKSPSSFYRPHHPVSSPCSAWPSRFCIWVLSPISSISQQVSAFELEEIRRSRFLGHRDYNVSLPFRRRDNCLPHNLDFPSCSCCCSSHTRDTHQQAQIQISRLPELSLFGMPLV